MRFARWWHLVTAAVSGSALLLQLVLVLASDNDTVIIRLVRLLSFFTIQSNIIVTAVALTLVGNPQRDGQLWRVARLASVACIGVTGLVYVTVLRGLDLGPAERVADIGLHYVTPVLAVVGWLLFGPRPRVQNRTIWLTLGYPVLWLAYTLARGELTDEYPYPFLDVATKGYAAVAANCLLVALVFLALSGLLLLLDRRLPRTSPARREASPAG